MYSCADVNKQQKMMSERMFFFRFCFSYFNGDSYLFSYSAYKYFAAVNYGFDRWVFEFWFLDLTCKIESTTADYSFYQLVVCYFLCFFNVYSHFSSRKLFPNKILTTFRDLCESSFVGIHCLMLNLLVFKLVFSSFMTNIYECVYESSCFHSNWHQ